MHFVGLFLSSLLKMHGPKKQKTTKKEEINSINLINNEKLVLSDLIQRKSITHMSNDYARNTDCNLKLKN